MIRIKGIDHVGVCVPALDAAASRWTDLLGLAPRDRETVAPMKTEALFLPAGPGATSVELVCPLPGNAGLEKFLDKHRGGGGLHHIAFEVEGIEAALAELAGKGVELIDARPRPGARGHKVAFLHPRAMGGVLVELVEPAH